MRFLARGVTRDWYNGWKRKHALKYQAVDSPDGVIRQSWGPMLGRRHDVTLLGQSGLLQYMQQWFNNPAGEAYCIYGDPAYQISPWLLAPYKGALTPGQQDFNTAMSSCRVTVEWGFGKVVALWPYVDYAKKQQVGLSAVGLGKQYSVAGILTNCHTCSTEIPRLRTSVSGPRHYVGTCRGRSDFLLKHEECYRQ